MNQIFITNITIEKVRHLENISIPLSETCMKPLILTGKNGSGKTSVVEALAEYLENICKKKLKRSRAGLDVQFNIDIGNLIPMKEKYHYILAYYSADRTFQTKKFQHVEKVPLKDSYGMREFPGKDFVKYLLDLKMTEALARNNGKTEKADEIQVWFQKLEWLLKDIFDDESVKLMFDEETFEFHIMQQGKEPFDFNTLSSGYQAVLDIVLDIMMRMQSQIQRSFDFNISGIVLIDEMETHLHLELQRHIMPLLTTVFPNIQFIVTSHSPFILNSLRDAVIYDLENHVLVEEGLNNVPYDGIVEGYFNADKMSDNLKEKFERYKKLVEKKVLSDDEMREIAELELYLDEIPDYLAMDISAEYQRMKLQFMKREDIDG